MIALSKESAATPAAPLRKLNVFQNLALGIGGIPEIFLQYAIGGMVYPIFNICYGVSPFLIGLSLSLPRLWELIFDPWIGVVSDRTRGRWGRRHPYIIGGALLGGITFALLWWVPGDWSPTFKGVWLIALTFLHFTGFSIFMSPYGALLGEVSDDPQERLRVMAYRLAYVNVGICGMAWLYRLSQIHLFSGAQGDPAKGVKVVGILIGFLLVALAIIPTLVCKDRRHSYTAREEPEIKIKESSMMRDLWGVREFRWILIATVVMLFCGYLVNSLGFYINLYYGFRGDTAAVATLSGVGGTVAAVVTILACPVIGWICSRLGQWKTLFLFLPLAAVGSASGWWAMRPEHPYAVIISTIFGSLGNTAFWIVMPSIIGQISYDYEKRTGKSAYGSFYALHGVANKLGTSLALFCTGFVLNITRFDVARGSAQLSGVLTEMRALNALIPIAGVMIAYWCLFHSQWIKNQKYGALAT
jgi:GPH family glycoside/pentoside/hexuronide:cation symporter